MLYKGRHRCIHNRRFENTKRLVEIYTRILLLVMALTEVGFFPDRKLSLAGKGLQTIPEGICETMERDEIAVLDLSDNQLRPSLPQLASPVAARVLVSLDFTGNRFNELPKEVALLAGLKYLNLRHNRIKSLPESFRDLKSLQQLNLSGNRIQQFPQPVLSLPNLLCLHLGGNQLQTIPPNINNLKE